MAWGGGGGRRHLLFYIFLAAFIRGVKGGTPPFYNKILIVIYLAPTIKVS